MCAVSDAAEHGRLIAAGAMQQSSSNLDMRRADASQQLECRIVCYGLNQRLAIDVVTAWTLIPYAGSTNPDQIRTDWSTWVSRITALGGSHDVYPSIGAHTRGANKILHCFEWAVV
jgi:hypothetical protein